MAQGHHQDDNTRLREQDPEPQSLSRKPTDERIRIENTRLPPLALFKKWWPKATTKDDNTKHRQQKPRPYIQTPNSDDKSSAGQEHKTEPLVLLKEVVAEGHHQDNNTSLRG